MIETTTAISRFLNAYTATPVGDTPVQPTLIEPVSEVEQPKFDYGVEVPPREWSPRVVSEAPARDGEFPRRFIDGSFYKTPVLCLRSPEGWPIPILVAEVGAVALQLSGRRLTRTFAMVERLLSFVADPFPWAEVESFSAAIASNSALRARFVVAGMPEEKANRFDYEVMRSQTEHRCLQDMRNAERLALAADPSLPTLIDGNLPPRIGNEAAEHRPLLIGVVKRPTVDLHPEGNRTLLDLRPGQRTPVFAVTRFENREADLPTASWFLKLAGGPRLAPNWGYIRVDIPYVQFKRVPESDRFGFVGRLSRWLMDARCRVESYGRMPVSLEPIVRAEEVMKPLFSSLPVLVNRLYRQAGLFRRDEA